MNTLRKLYVGLDTVLDLRLGVMSYLNPDFAFAVTTEPSYFQRDQDFFGSDKLYTVTQQPYGSLDPRQYHEILTRHTSSVVRTAIETRINKFVLNLCGTHLQNTIREGQELHIEIDVNVYPFRFPPETGALLNQIVQQYFGKHFKTNLVYHPWESLSLETVRETYFGMVMYDYTAWVNGQELAFKKKPLRDTCLYVPRLFFGGRPPQEHLDECTKRRVDPFEQNTRILGPLLPIQYLPVAFFCAALPQNLDAYTQPV